MRKATWRTERSSDTLMRSPRNMASRWLGEVRLLGQLQEQPHRLVGDPVLGVVEVEADGLHPEPFTAVRILGEQLPQVPPGDLVVVRLERGPRRTLA